MAGPGIDLVFDAAQQFPPQASARIRRLAPDLLVCLWGAVPGSEAPDFDLNPKLALAALELARVCRIPRMAALSTGAVYGAGDGTAFRETAPLVGASGYARSKIEMEAQLAGSTDVAVTCLRLANLFGADQLALSMTKATTQSPLSLDRFADGQGPLRSYASPAFLAALLDALAACPADSMPPVLNVAYSEGGIGMEDVMKSSGDHGRPVPWHWRPAPETALRSHVLECSALFQRFPALEAKRCRTADALVAAAGATKGGGE
jgi:hypothetical protein